MTPSQICKEHGITLAKLSRSLGYKQNGQPVVSERTLINWHKNKPLLFDAVVLGQSKLIQGLV
jgi:hypothetical protein